MVGAGQSRGLCLPLLPRNGTLFWNSECRHIVSFSDEDLNKLCY